MSANTTREEYFFKKINLKFQNTGGWEGKIMLNPRRDTGKTVNYIHAKSFQQRVPRKKLHSLCVQLYPTDII